MVSFDTTCAIGFQRSFFRVLIIPWIRVQDFGMVRSCYAFFSLGVFSWYWKEKLNPASKHAVLSVFKGKVVFLFYKRDAI